MSVTSSTGAGKLDSAKEETKTVEGLLDTWKREIEAAHAHYRDYWKTSDDILARYRDERDAERVNTGARLNFFWSNVQVLKSTLYVKPPKMDVSRLFKDYQDDVARVSGIILERLLNHDIEKDDSDFDVAVRQAIDDWLIVGTGQVWYRYEVQTETVDVPAPTDPTTGAPIGEPTTEERITNENALSDFVFWKDFLCSPARVWQEVRWVGRRVYMDRDALIVRFGEKKGKAIPTKARKNDGSTVAPNKDGASDSPWATAEVWEIWDKTSKKAFWLCRDFDEMLDERDDPMQLDNFFPCPQPMLANQTNNTLIPRADYTLARDQYQQIDVIVARLRMLIDACKVRGVYDKESAPALSNVLQGNENKMIPVDNWAMFAERGGLKGIMDWVPIEVISNVIQVLRMDLAEQKQQLYEVLGISDIMRGATRASETATAQTLKAQFGSTRLQFKQFEIARFVRDTQRIKADIISKHYQPQTIVLRSNIDHTPDAAIAPQAIQLLKDEGISHYRLNIEADSMSAVDWAEERDARTQFLQAVGQFVSMTTPLVQQKPEAAPFLMQMLQWSIAGFRVGKSIEGVIDQAIQAMNQQPPAGPTPEQQANIIKTQTEAGKNVAETDKIKAETGGAVVDMHSKRIENAIATGQLPRTQPPMTMKEATTGYEGS